MELTLNLEGESLKIKLNEAELNAIKSRQGAQQADAATVLEWLGERLNEELETVVNRYGEARDGEG